MVTACADGVADRCNVKTIFGEDDFVVSSVGKVTVEVLCGEAAGSMTGDGDVSRASVWRA